MTQDAWLDLLEQIKKTSEEFSEESLPLVDSNGKEIERGSLQVVEFTTSSGIRFRLERSRKPRVLQQNGSFSSRAGTSAAISYAVSDTEFTDHVELFKEDEYGEWQPMSFEVLAGGDRA